MFSGKVTLWYTKMKWKQVQRNMLMQLVCWYWEKWKCMNWLKYFRNILYDYISQFAIPLSVHLASVITFVITSPAGCKALCSASNGCHVHWIDTPQLFFMGELWDSLINDYGKFNILHYQDTCAVFNNRGGGIFNYLLLISHNYNHNELHTFSWLDTRLLWIYNIQYVLHECLWKLLWMELICDKLDITNYFSNNSRVP